MSFATCENEDRSRKFPFILFSAFADAKRSDINNQNARTSIINAFLNRVSMTLNVVIDPQTYSRIKKGLS